MTARFSLRQLTRAPGPGDARSVSFLAEFPYLISIVTNEPQPGFFLTNLILNGFVRKRVFEELSQLLGYGLNCDRW